MSFAPGRIMQLEGFLSQVAGDGPCVAVHSNKSLVLVAPAGYEVRAIDGVKTKTLNALFDAFAEAWHFPPSFTCYRSAGAFDDWMRDFDNLTNPALDRPRASGYLTEVCNAHLLLTEEPEAFSWFANHIPFYRDYYRDGLDPPAAFALLLSVPDDQLEAVRARWLAAGVQVPTVCAKYKDLILSYVNRTISAEEFESAYLALFKHDSDQVLGAEFNILEKLFFAIDDFVADPELRALYMVWTKKTYVNTRVKHTSSFT